MEAQSARIGIVTGIRQQARNSERVSIYVDGSYSFGVHAQLVAQHDVAVGAALGREEVDRLLREDRKLRAVSRGILYIAHRPRTHAEVQRRMERYGYSGEEVAFVLQRLAAMGLIDDPQYAETFARTRFETKGHGPNRIRSDLRRKGVASGTVDHVVAMFEDETALADAAKNLLEKRSLVLLREADAMKRRRKGIDFLVRRGYSYALSARLVDEAFRD